MLHHSDLLLRRGVSYTTGDAGFTNDAELYSLALAGAKRELSAAVDFKVARADSLGATTTVFSAERLFTLAAEEWALSNLLDVCRAKTDDLEIVVVVRAIEPFLRSYLRQLVENGMFLLDDVDLASWCAASVRALWELPDRVTAIGLREDDATTNLVATFFEALGAPAPIPDARENVSSRRSLAYHAPIGMASRIFALLTDQDINSQEVDDYRIELANEYDQALQGDTTGMALRVYESLTQILGVAFDQYVAFSAARVSEDDHQLVQSLVSQVVSRNR